MDHLADSIAKLSQGRKKWYIHVGREGLPVDNSPGEKCEPVIVFERTPYVYGVRSFTRMDRNVPNYRNGLPELTLT